MKIKNRKDILLIIIYVALIIFALVNFEKIFSFLRYVINIFAPFIIGLLLAFILNILIKFIETKIFGKIKDGKVWSKIKRPISLVLSIVLVVLVIYFIMNMLIPQLKNSLSLFSETLPEYKEDILNILNRFDVEPSVTAKVSTYVDNFTTAIVDYIKGNSKDILSVTTTVATSIISIISKGLIAMVFAIYVIAQKETLIRQANKVMNAYLKPRTNQKIQDIATMSNKIFTSFFTGQCLEALITGVLCFIGMLILRLPYASTISVLVGFTSLIPIFGAVIGAVLGAFLIVIVSPVKAVIFIVFIIIVHQIGGNVLYPKIVGKSVGLPGIWIFLCVIVGASIGGILGMLIATPLFSVLYLLFEKMVEDKIKKDKITIKVEEKKT